jgi:hypothetical protein
MGLNTNTIHIIKLIWKEAIYSTFLHVVAVQAHLQEESSISRNYQIVEKSIFCIIADSPTWNIPSVKNNHSQ